MEDSKKPEKGRDIVSLGPQLPDGDAPYVRMKDTDEGPVVEYGTAHMVEPETETDREVLKLRHLHDNHFQVEEVVRSGPAQVNSTAYRANWETIFGGKQTVGQA